MSVNFFGFTRVSVGFFDSYDTDCCSTLQTEVNGILNKLKYLEDEINEVKRKIADKLVVSKTVGATTVTQIRRNYLQYIIQYGVPDDGNWIESRLAEFD